MATSWERAAHLANDVLFVLYLICNLVVSHFGFEGGTIVLIAPIPGHCLSFTFCMIRMTLIECNPNVLSQ